VTDECPLGWKAISHIQISLDISGSSLDECSSASAIRCDYDLIADMVSQHILVLGEGVDS
jgi:hypothetical protein